jgi:hypothetical protein
MAFSCGSKGRVAINKEFYEEGFVIATTRYKK